MLLHLIISQAKKLLGYFKLDLLQLYFWTCEVVIVTRHHNFVYREEESIHIDGLSPNEVKQLREQSEKHIFQAEVNRMMKLIINSLYRNKEASKNLLFLQTGNIHYIFTRASSCNKRALPIPTTLYPRQ